MPVHVWTDAYIAVNGTSLTDHAHTVTVDDNADQIDATTFGPAGYKQFMPGLKDGSVTVSFFQDFDASKVHSILQPLYATGGTFGVEVRPTSAAASATNPNVRMTARLYGYSGMAGKVGDAATFDSVFHNAGTAGLVWGTS